MFYYDFVLNLSYSIENVRMLPKDKNQLRQQGEFEKASKKLGFSVISCHTDPDYFRVVVMVDQPEQLNKLRLSTLLDRCIELFHSYYVWSEVIKTTQTSFELVRNFQGYSQLQIEIDQHQTDENYLFMEAYVYNGAQLILKNNIAFDQLKSDLSIYNDIKDETNRVNRQPAYIF